MIGRYQVDVWYSRQVIAEDRDDAEAQAMADVRATVDQPSSVEVVYVAPREQVKS